MKLIGHTNKKINFYSHRVTCMCHRITGHQYSTNVIKKEKGLYRVCQLGYDVRCAALLNQCESGEMWKSTAQLRDKGKKIICMTDSGLVMVMVLMINA